MSAICNEWTNGLVERQSAGNPPPSFRKQDWLLLDLSNADHAGRSLTACGHKRHLCGLRSGQYRYCNDKKNLVLSFIITCKYLLLNYISSPCQIWVDLKFLEISPKVVERMIHFNTLTWNFSIKSLSKSASNVYQFTSRFKASHKVN